MCFIMWEPAVSKQDMESISQVESRACITFISNVHLIATILVTAIVRNRSVQTDNVWWMPLYISGEDSEEMNLS